jgi:transcription antitermination protein NusB
MKRKTQRDFLVKTVFAQFFQSDLSLNEIFNSLIDSFSREHLREDERQKYIDPLIKHIEQDKESYQSLISKHLKKTWKIDRIPIIDRAIIEVAVSEIKNSDDIPFDVTANEAVELAKIYSTEKSPSFVNGILVSIFEELKQDLVK